MEHDIGIFQTPKVRREKTESLANYEQVDRLLKLQTTGDPP